MASALEVVLGPNGLVNDPRGSRCGARCEPISSTVEGLLFVLGHGDDRPGNELNTLDSFDVVRASGADGIECHVR